MTQTYVEFARELSTLFGRWRLASEVHTFEQLCELLLLEQFHDTLPERIATYLGERNAKTLTEAATIADEYALTHKVRGDRHREMFFGHQKGSGSEFPPFKSGNSSSKLDQSRICNYCLGKGHWKAECPVLKSKHKLQQGYRHIKPVALSAPARVGEKADAIAAVRQHTKSTIVDALASQVAEPAPVPVESPALSQVMSSETDMSSVIDPGYEPFVSSGFVSLVGSDEKIPVKILRDSGALDSFILSSVLPFSSDTDTGNFVLVRGMGLSLVPAPLHKVILCSGLVEGEVVLGVRPALPVDGVQVILGNDLAGGRIWADSQPSLVVTRTPSVNKAEMEDKGHSRVFPAWQLLGLRLV